MMLMVLARRQLTAKGRRLRVWPGATPRRYVDTTEYHTRLDDLDRARSTSGGSR